MVSRGLDGESHCHKSNKTVNHCHEENQSLTITGCQEENHLVEPTPHRRDS